MGLFGRKGGKGEEPPPAEPSRYKLRLRHPLAVENMPKFAADIVTSAKNVSNVDLDYSVASIPSIDRIVQGFADDGVAEEQIGETLVGFGAYFGEVIVRNAGATWRDITGEPQAPMMGPLPMVVEMPDGRMWNPIGKVFKRLTDPADDLMFFYEGVIASPR